MSVTPALHLQLDSDIELRSLTEADADEFFALIQANREHLDQWLRWSGRVKTLEDAQAYVRRFAQKEAEGHGFHAGVWQQGRLCGGIVCHFINRESHKTEIGYWLAANAVGKGIVTRATRAVLDYLFEHEHLHRVEIQCGVENVRSRAVPERLGFVNEGIKRESDWVTTHYVDHVMYSMLAHEWQSKRLLTDSEEVERIPVEVLFPDGSIGIGTFELSKPDTNRHVKLCLVMPSGERVATKEPQWDYFYAMVEIRKVLDQNGIRLRCYGASLNVCVSGMARDMGLGMKAYQIKPGQPISPRNLVPTFGSGPDITPASVAEQQAYIKQWLYSSSDKNKERNN